MKINQQDLQAYIVVADGRPYTAISKIPITIGRNLQALYSITAVLNWLFAVPTGSGLNGFQITGEIIKLGLQKVRKKLKFFKVEMISCFRGCTKSHGRNYIQRDKWSSFCNSKVFRFGCIRPVETRLANSRKNPCNWRYSCNYYPRLSNTIQFYSTR